MVFSEKYLIRKGLNDDEMYLAYSFYKLACALGAVHVVI
jgi:hypothetical protein